MIRWRLASSFPRSDTIWWAVTELTTLVATLTDSGLVIEPSPAGEPVPASTVLDAVGSGEVACGHTAGSFFVDRDPVLSLATFAPFGMDARRHAAWLCGPGAHHAEAAWARQGVVALPCLNTGAQTGGWFRAPLRSPEDFAGLRIRTAGLPAFVLARLGAQPVSLAADQILPALRAGTLDAADWIGPHDDLQMGFHTAAPFYHAPGVLEPSAQLSLIVGQDAWAGLPPAYQAALRCAAATVERALLVRYDNLNPPALAALLQAGVTLCRFPDSILAALKAASAAVLDDFASRDAAFTAALGNYRSFAAAGTAWLRLGELDTARSITEPAGKAESRTRDIELEDYPMPETASHFAAFIADVQAQTPLRAAITRHYRAPEPNCVAALLPAATLSPAMAERARVTAVTLVEALRAKGARGTVEGLVREYDLSSQEGVALMCLAEALLRIPDTATRDALIRDKISTGDWRGHVGRSPSLFVNAATWGLVITGKLVGDSAGEGGLGAALTRLIARGGEPLIRRGVDMAMRMMGEQFVTGQTIDEALRNARRLEAKSYRYSYDMLGEAATTAHDAERYYRDYETAIHAIGTASAGRGLYDGPGISIKLSALHPRYTRLQRARVMAELLPRVQALAALARRYDIGLNIDAEEADRLDLSLDLLEALCLDPALDGWDGIGFVVQAYQKRAPFVLDWMIDLARRSGHRLMVRLVKGAYWDSEIKRAQVDGLEGFPVFTRKIHTDVSYLACAGKLLGAPDAVFPQFATHNAYTVAAIHSMAGDAFRPGDYEFQCLHGMGEPLYEEVVGHNRLNRPARIYAPVGTHETLLAYLVRRLLENGANSSFVNRIQDPSVPVAELAADPVAQVAASRPVGASHDRIALPRDLFAPVRANSAGLDLSDELQLAALGAALGDSADTVWRAAPAGVDAQGEPVRNPADRTDMVGYVVAATPAQVDAALDAATRAAPGWQGTAPAERAACLLHAADALEAEMPALLGLIVREAGKSFANAVAEVREAVDFLRYYATEAARTLAPDNHAALGAVTCISPWNFPLAIFTGQVAAALAAGNTVLAKPAEETPLIAARTVALLHKAGVPADVLHLLPGHGEIGALLVADPRTRGVVFTGSTEVARLIQRELAKRLNPDGSPVPLIAETGGQNALVVDSSALAEQVVADVLVSAFDSAGQRCSALRVLCLQEEVADRTLAMLRGALAELSVGNPDRLCTDIGPVISAEAQDGIMAHVQAMRDAGHAVHQAVLPDCCVSGTFVPPIIIELDAMASLQREVFGPVLHVLRFRRDGLDALLSEINATGYGLTFGIHSRIDETIARVTAKAGAGNIYVNRNLIGAVVGVQPFGGHGLSGTGPKAGGPLYLRRLLTRRPSDIGLVSVHRPACAWAGWLEQAGEPAAAQRFKALVASTLAGMETELPGPVGERNLYSTSCRGTVLCVADSRAALLDQVGAALATGNTALVAAGALPGAPHTLVRETYYPGREDVAAILHSGPGLQAQVQAACLRTGPIVPVYVAGSDGVYPLEWLVQERSVSTNTTAAGGNANLMVVA